MEKLTVREGGADDNFGPRRVDCSGIRGQREYNPELRLTSRSGLNPRVTDSVGDNASGENARSLCEEGRQCTDILEGWDAWRDPREERPERS